MFLTHRLLLFFEVEALRMTSQQHINVLPPADVGTFLALGFGALLSRVAPLVGVVLRPLFTALQVG